MTLTKIRPKEEKRNQYVGKQLSVLNENLKEKDATIRQLKNELKESDLTIQYLSIQVDRLRNELSLINSPIK